MAKVVQLCKLSLVGTHRPSMLESWPRVAAEGLKKRGDSALANRMTEGFVELQAM